MNDLTPTPPERRQVAHQQPAKPSRAMSTAKALEAVDTTYLVPFRAFERLTPKIALPVNGHVLIDGVEYIVERRLGDRWHLLSFDKDILFLTDEEAVGKMAEGALIVRHGDARAAIPGLVEAGLLTEQDVAGRVRRIVDSSLDRFDSRYAAVTAYARAFDLSPQKAAAEFQAANVTMLRREGRQKVVWADRASVIAAMGEQWDLTKLDGFSSTIWNAFRRYLNEIGSPNRLVNAVGAAARLRSGSGFTLLHLSTDLEERSLAVSASAVQKSSPAWFELLKAHEAHVREIWPEATVHSDSESIALTQIHAIGSEAVANGLIPVVTSVDYIATRLRMLRLMEVTEASPIFSVEQAA